MHIITVIFLTATMHDPLPADTYGEPGSPEYYRAFPKDGPADLTGDAE